MIDETRVFFWKTVALAFDFLDINKASTLYDCLIWLLDDTLTFKFLAVGWLELFGFLEDYGGAFTAYS